VLGDDLLWADGEIDRKVLLVENLRVGQVVPGADRGDFGRRTKQCGR
jgi:hypothetical protein